MSALLTSFYPDTWVSSLATLLASTLVVGEFEPEFVDIVLQIALSTRTLTARNVRLTHMRSVRVVRVRYHSTEYRR